MLWLNVETAIWVSEHLSTPWTHPPEWDWSRVTWRVCPECCFVEPQYLAYQCPRPKGEINSFGGVWHRTGFTASCTVETVPLPAALNETLWSALRVGGTNAVVQVLASTLPEDVGLTSAVDKMRVRVNARRRRPK